jgi:hypothetical protein
MVNEWEENIQDPYLKPYIKQTDIVKACIDTSTCKKVTEQREDNTFRNLWGKIDA